MTDAEHHKFQRLVEDAMWFMRSITEYYGVEQGLATWDLISTHMEPEIKTEIFLKMISGERPGTVALRRGTCEQAVTAIKTIRSILCLGLKEAKDIWDASKNPDWHVIRDVNRDQRHQLLEELAKLGMEVK